MTRTGQFRQARFGYDVAENLSPNRYEETWRRKYWQLVIKKKCSSKNPLPEVISSKTESTLFMYHRHINQHFHLLDCITRLKGLSEVNVIPIEGRDISDIHQSLSCTNRSYHFIFPLSDWWGGTWNMSMCANLGNVFPKERQWTSVEESHTVYLCLISLCIPAHMNVIAKLRDIYHYSKSACWLNAQLFGQPIDSLHQLRQDKRVFIFGHRSSPVYIAAPQPCFLWQSWPKPERAAVQCSKLGQRKRLVVM